LLAVTASVVVTTATTRSARAHAFLLESNPVDSSVVDSPPERVYLRFDEPVTLSPQSIQLLDATGKRIPLPPADHVDGNATTAGTTLPDDLANGTYAIAWRVTSDDSHIVSGAVQFSIGAPSAIVVTAKHSDAVPAIVQGIARGVAFLGFALALGGFVFLQLMWSAGRDDRRARRILGLGVVSLAAATVVIFLAQGPLATGESLTTALSKAAWDATMGSVLGPAMLVRMVLLAGLGLVVGFLAVRRRGRADEGLTPVAPRPLSRAMLGIVGVYTLAITATWPLADHARSGLQKQLAIPATAVHLLAMALWMGGVVLLVLTVLALRRSAEPERVGAVHGALERFSTVAQACFIALAVTGVYLSWRQVGTAKALIYTNFGRLLLVKLAIVLAIVALAAGARAFVRRHRSRAAEQDTTSALRRLRFRLGGEVVFGVAVIGVTAALVNTPPARTAYTPPFHTTKRIEAGPGTSPALVGATVQVDIKPARAGANIIDVYITGANGDLMRVREVSGQLQATRAGLTSLPVTISSGEPGHYVATAVSIPFPGRWTLRLDLRTSDFDETTLPIAFTVR
jgi:copper transport protein